MYILQSAQSLRGRDREETEDCRLRICLDFGRGAARNSKKRGVSSKVLHLAIQGLRERESASKQWQPEMGRGLEFPPASRAPETEGLAPTEAGPGLGA